ncbi:polyamine-transporting ATPase 13A3-like isoform X2 [Ostrea edulis]|nr:polyamine-transporting ATPase 13A3-like isoform X2 [Ostrea edulis]XP_056008609.1 polyamine-transporting ATPase 13A3-like isoform X2 [Ostrea edulis]
MFDRAGQNGYSRLLSDQTFLNKDTDDEFVCYGYKADQCKEGLFLFLVFLTGGLILLLLQWRPQMVCYLRKRRCSLNQADTILLQDTYKQYSLAFVNEKSFSRPETLLPSNHGHEGSDYESPSDSSSLTTQGELKFRYFDHQHVRYIWDRGGHLFSKLKDLSEGTKCVMIQESFHGLTAKEQRQKQVVYGENTIEVEVKSYWRLFIEEVMNPFYVFQIASITLWLCDQYYYYAACILFISLVSVGISLYETKRQSVVLHDMVTTKAQTIGVCRGEEIYEEVPTGNLVPGDVITIPQHGCVMTCDAVLITGTCIVNESMLTGESVPVTKTPLTPQEDEEVFSPDVHKRHTLFSGTHILQTRFYGNSKVKAVVVRTGFRTAKGELVRAILFPKPLDFKFYRDAMKFILFLGCMAALGMTYSIIVYVKQGVYPMRILVRVLDIITIIVPPALPAAMTVGTVFAQSRLKKKGIYCISPPRINFCGRLDVFCFDKTGTLTEDGLDMWGVLPIEDQGFCGAVEDPSRLEVGPFITCMATCHSLTMIDGELSGDPLDLIMFNSTKWVLDEPGRDTSKFDTIMPTVVRPCTKDTFSSPENPFEVGIIRQFTFSSSVQRMSVITRTLSEDGMEVYCKGAPEKIASLCLQDTVPHEFQDILHRYTIQGYRVIAVAYKKLDPKLTWHQAQRISRDKVEFDMNFLGMIVLQNKLKQKTKPVIHKLKEAKLRTVMVTGDMIQTAISVARNCGMVPPKDRVIIVEASPPDAHNPASIKWVTAETPDEGTDQYTDSDYTEDVHLDLDNPHKMQNFHFAVSGHSFGVLTTHFPEYIPRVVVKGTVFARMSPDQKLQLIEDLQNIGYNVGMCGDGANDCEALKAAHAGISLSEAEASVAAPFTSRIPNIECVLQAMREGRAALVTSFGCFKYMALYSFIQFVSVLILYTFDANLADMQFLYVDLVITTSVAVLMGYSSSYDKLVPQRPPGSLVKPSNLLSIISQVLLVIVFQIAAFLYLHFQPWYKPVKKDLNADNTYCWETSVIFLVSTYQYIASAFVFSKGPPFRQPIYKNVPFLLTLCVLFAFSTYMLMLPFSPILKFFAVMPLGERTVEFRSVLLALSVGFIFAACLLEYLIMDVKCTQKCLESCSNCCGQGNNKDHYKEIQNEIQLSDWPPVGQVTYAALNEPHIQIEEDFFRSQGEILVN